MIDGAILYRFLAISFRSRCLRGCVSSGNRYRDAPNPHHLWWRKIMATRLAPPYNTSSSASHWGGHFALGLSLPVILFFLAQKVVFAGVFITGRENHEKLSRAIIVI